MRLRVQRNSILEAPTYIKEVGSVVIFDDYDQPIGIFCKDPMDAGIRVLTVDMPGFKDELRTRFNLETRIDNVEVIEAPKR
jgi:hypothetical protein